MIHITSSDPLATLPADANTSSGSAEFEVTFNTATATGWTVTAHELDADLADDTGTPTLVLASLVSATQSTVSASPISVVADGSTTSTVTVTLKDAYNNPISDKTVTLAKTSGPGTPTISAASGCQMR